MAQCKEELESLYDTSRWELIPAWEEYWEEMNLRHSEMGSRTDQEIDV